MSVLFFALFFLVHLSLFFLGPAVIEKKLTKVTRKRKLENTTKYYLVYGIITLFYIAIYIIMYNVYNDAIKYIINRGLTNIFSNNVLVLGISAVAYFLITFIYVTYTYILSSKFFQYKKNNDAYTVIGITALLSILSYYSFYSVLDLSLYQFNNLLLNSIYQFDYELAPYLFFAIVLFKLAISFIKE